MEKSRSSGEQGPADEHIAALPTLVSLDSMDIFGVPDIPTQQETLDSIYSRFVTPQKTEAAPARKATMNMRMRTPDEATSVESNKQLYSHTRSQDATCAEVGITSSPKHVPVWQQQPAWRQGSEGVKANFPSSAAQSRKANVSYRGHQRSASPHNILARRPRESSLEMKAHLEATARQENKEAGRISRAGSAAAAVGQHDQAPASVTMRDQQVQHIDEVQGSGEVQDLTYEIKPSSNSIIPAESIDADRGVSKMQPQQVGGETALPQQGEEDAAVPEHEEKQTSLGDAMSQGALAIASSLDQDIKFVRASPTVANVYVSTLHEKSTESSIPVPSVRSSGSQQAGKELAQYAIDPKSFISRLLPRINVRTESGNSDIKGSRHVPKAMARPEQKKVSRWCCFQK